MSRSIENVGIVGTGLIGAGWAAFYAGKGLGVKLYDAESSARRAGHERALSYLAFLKEHEVISADEHEDAAARMTVADSLDDMAEGVELIQESVKEDYAVKKELFQALDRATEAQVIVASSSSGLLISELQKVMSHPGRSIIAHPFNPPHLIPLVELVPGEQTAAETTAQMKFFFESRGKAAVVLHKEVPGHIANRLQAAVWREAIHLALTGVASVEDIDRALCTGPGLRWALMGQNQIFHLGGGEGGIEYFVDHIGSSFSALWEDMADWKALPGETKRVLSEGVAAGMKGRTMEQMKQWRDEKLVELLKMIGS